MTTAKDFRPFVLQVEDALGTCDSRRGLTKPQLARMFDATEQRIGSAISSIRVRLSRDIFGHNESGTASKDKTFLVCWKELYVGTSHIYKYAILPADDPRSVEYLREKQSRVVASAYTSGALAKAAVNVDPLNHEANERLDVALRFFEIARDYSKDMNSLCPEFKAPEYDKYCESA